MRRPTRCSTRGLSVIFSGGTYVTWTITGSVRVRVTRVGGMNAVVSGVFLGPSLSGNQPPTVSITGPSASATFTLGSVIPITADAADLDGTVASVAFYANGQLLHTDPSAPYRVQLDQRARWHTYVDGRRDRRRRTAGHVRPDHDLGCRAGGASALFAGLGHDDAR
jgi:hypothetical protein